MPEIVIKKNGEKQLYQKEKVINSLRRIGAKEETINFILEVLDKKLPSVITTKKLYQEVFTLLKEKGKGKHLITKFNLKNALFLLGPSGFPFEKFFAKILNCYGYETRLNLFLNGKCLVYEIDVLAKKENIDYLIECKFHQFLKKKEDIKNILYVYARYLDLRENFKNSRAWLATNTKFTTETIKFAECYNIKLTSWNYPGDENLIKLIEDKKLYPVTILTCCSQRIFKELFKFDIILVKDLLKKEKRFIGKIANLNNKEVDLVFEEASRLLNN